METGVVLALPNQITSVTVPRFLCSWTSLNVIRAISSSNSRLIRLQNHPRLSSGLNIAQYPLWIIHLNEVTIETAMASEGAPWHEAYPNPKNTAETISRSEVLERLNHGEQPGRDFLLVDLRRNDHAVRHIVYGAESYLSSNAYSSPVGWHHSRLVESASPKSLPHPSDPIQPL